MDKIILNYTKGIVSKDFFNDINFLIAKCDEAYDFTIEKKSIGIYQKDEDLTTIRGYYVNQATNGGYIGDDFEGTINIELPDGRFLQFYYQM
jgi:hypothetical protein